MDGELDNLSLYLTLSNGSYAFCLSLCPSVDQFKTIMQLRSPEHCSSVAEE